MKNRNRALALCGIVILAGCAATPNGDGAAQDAEAAATPPPATPRREVPDTRRIPPQPAQPAAPVEPGKQIVAMTFGRGIAKGPADMTFMLNVELFEDESVGGTFSYSANTGAGTLDIEAEATCASLDHDAARAWVGGKITRNGSTDPRFSGEPGTEVWMRALDRNAEKMQPKISGPLLAGGEFNSAEDFCSKRPWSDDEFYVVDPGALAIFP